MARGKEEGRLALKDRLAPLAQAHLSRSQAWLLALVLALALGRVAQVQGVNATGLCLAGLATGVLVLKPKPGPFMLVLALLSPGALLFALNNLAPMASGQAVALALAAWAALRAARGDKPPRKLGVGAIFLALTLLQQEMFFFIPLLAAYLAFIHPERPWRLKHWALIMAPAVLAMAAMDTLSPLASAASISRGLHVSGSAVALMMLAGLLGALPVMLWFMGRSEAHRRLSHYFSQASAKLLLVLALFMQIVLFAMARDWGRWLMLDLCLLGLASLAAARRWDLAGDGRKKHLDAEVPWLAFALMSLLYLAGWRLSNDLGGLCLPGWLG